MKTDKLLVTLISTAGAGIMITFVAFYLTLRIFYIGIPTMDPVVRLTSYFIIYALVLDALAILLTIAYGIRKIINSGIKIDKNFFRFDPEDMDK